MAPLVVAPRSIFFHDYRSCALLAAAYVDHIESLPPGPEVQQMIDYLSSGHHPFAICQMLIIGGQNGLLKLCKFVSHLPPTVWNSCRDDLLEFFGTGDGATIYNRYMERYSGRIYLTIGDVPTLYLPYEEMAGMLQALDPLDSSTYSSVSSLLDQVRKLDLSDCTTNVVRFQYCSESESSASKDSKPATATRRKFSLSWISALMRTRLMGSPDNARNVL